MVWRRRKEWSKEDLLASQLAMNQQTWRELRRHGVSEDTELRLDFFYEAPSKPGAQELVAFLQEETDYEVRVEADSVTGSTQPTTISEDILDQWVEWMVFAGYEHGRCKFDGWGAEIS